jgi:D-glycero-alpha-D-manno-heptose-7-phosphate kinase
MPDRRAPCRRRSAAAAVCPEVPGHDGPVHTGPVPLEIVKAAAPIRICDNGGWTDTWFARNGRVCNIAVSPYVEVEVKIHGRESQAHRVVLDVADYHERYGVEFDALPGRHPLLEAIVDESAIPDDVSLEISISSAAPPGSSTGTSASVAVALIGALDALTPGRLAPHEVARSAHRIEVERLETESGVQDQLCAAFGGVNYIEVAPYPHASVTRLRLRRTTWLELDRRLVLVYLGRAHVSSTIHDRVISALTADPQTSDRLLDPLRQAAQDARDALLSGDLASLGRAMTANTEAQRRLHDGLVGDPAQAVIDVAAAHGALGCKVNGAGGEGGSVTLLCGAGAGAIRGIAEALRRTDPLFEVVPTALSSVGLRVWRT